MKRLNTALLTLITFAAYSDIFTNNVQIGGGMSFGLCDNFYETTSLQSIISEKKLDAEKNATWFLYNTVSNQSGSTIFIGMTNSFAFDLTTTNGVSISKTSKGVAMSVGPKSLTDFYANKPIRIGAGFQDFPKLEELFNFPSNGVYIFELRCWAWNNSNNQFVLSSPIRVQVIKDDTNSPPPNLLPTSQTNSPAK